MTPIKPTSPRTHAIVLALSIAAAAAAACTKPAGGPLSNTFDNAKIASVPLESKQPVVQAQQSHDLAVSQRNHAVADHRDGEIEVDLAEYQADHNLIASQLGASRVPGATSSPPTAESAALARRTAEAKVDFMRARRAWLASRAEWSLYAVYAAQARLELERARVAQSHNLVAAGFDPQVYQRQAEDREKAAEQAKQRTETARNGAEVKLAAWTELERSFLQAVGIKAPIESTRYAKEWTAPAPAPAPAAAPAPAPADAAPATPPAAAAPPPAATAPAP